jgi:hypothetical protein
MLNPVENPTFGLRVEAQCSVDVEAAETDLWPYRPRTIALLRRYGHVSVEVGRLPSLVGREIFRSRLTSYSMKSFEDAVVFITDIERILAKLSDFDRRLLGMSILEEYTRVEMSIVLGLSESTIERLLRKTIDELSRDLLAQGLLDRLPM